jgi:hypothetical protein
MACPTRQRGLHRGVESLDGKPVIVATNSGVPVALGRFRVERDSLLSHRQRVEVAFETEALSCRIRIPDARLEEIKQTWDGTTYQYRLPAGDSVWLNGSRQTAAQPDVPSPAIEAFPVPRKIASLPPIPRGQAPGRSADSRAPT